MPAPLRHSSAGAGRDVDDAAAGARHGVDRGAAAQHAADEIHVDLLRTAPPSVSRIGAAAKPPAIWIEAHSGAMP